MDSAVPTFAANDLVLIGPEHELDDLAIGFQNRRSVKPRTYSSYAIPPVSLFAGAAVIFVFEVEKRQRYEQLKMACAYQRRHGGIKLVFGFSRCLDVRLAERVRRSGADLFLL
jgi:hypothetical protein